LKQLMDRAEQSTGGAFVNVIAYKGEYAHAARAQKSVFMARAHGKPKRQKCRTLVPPSSAQVNARLARLNEVFSVVGRGSIWRQYLANDTQSEWAARARRCLKFCEMQVHISNS
jgi:hypothetical protein